MIVYLIGYMGCGKSSIGRKVAKAAGYGFADTDRMVEEQCGKTIPELFACEGEERFRELEREVLERLSRSQDDIVVATGGGMPCRGGNIGLMNDTGITVYLQSSPARIVGRLGPGRERRPLIKGMDDARLLEFIGESLPVREPFYVQASMTINCDGASDDYIVGHILSCIEVACKK